MFRRCALFILLAIMVLANAQRANAQWWVPLTNFWLNESFEIAEDATEDSLVIADDSVTTFVPDGPAQSAAADAISGAAQDATDGLNIGLVAAEEAVPDCRGTGSRCRTSRSDLCCSQSCTSSRWWSSRGRCD